MTIFIGTTKGLFRIGDAGEESRVEASEFIGRMVYAVGKSTGRVWAAPYSEWTGCELMYSEDDGATWTISEGQVAFPESADAAVAKIWQIVEDADGRLFAGVEPSALFVSEDRGASWNLCEGLWNHPHRAEWTPGYGGQALHTINIVGRNEWVIAMSTGGVYRSDDGGSSWYPSNQKILAPFYPDPEREFGQCVHKFASHSSNPNEMFLQHHWGVYKSVDAGRSWQNIPKENFPSDFGFVCVANAPETAFVIPIKADVDRVFPDGKMRVYRTTDGGDSWTALSKGLPQKDVYDCVLRDSFHAAGEKLCFGTTSGNVYFSSDNGDSWSRIAESLPRITCVRVFE